MFSQIKQNKQLKNRAPPGGGEGSLETPSREHGSPCLDGGYRQEHQVFGEPDLLLDEGLGIADPGEETVVARGGEGALPDIFLGDEEAAALRLGGVLGAVRHQGLEPLLDERGDVDDEAG